MNSLGDLRIIGQLRQDPVARQLAAHDPDGKPVLLTVGVSPLHEDEAAAYQAWAERLSACSRHPHVAEVFAHGVVDGCAHLAVRTGERRTLAELLAARGPMPAEHVRALGIALADALAAAHEAGLFHLAVRPELVFVDDEEGPVLVGFDAAAPGLVRPMATGRLAAPEYRAPRGMLDGRGPVVGAAVDVYALAAMLYEALGGALPWAAASGAPAADDAAARSAPLPDLPEAPPTLVATLRRAVAVHPAQRLTAAGLRDELLSATRQARRIAPDDEPHLPDAALGVAAGLSMLGASAAPPAAEPAAPQPSDLSAADVERLRGPAQVAGPDETLRPLVGMWRIAAETGDQELLVVRPDGSVTWTGSDDEGPFVASGEALPIGGRSYRLLLNEPAGAAGFYVDLMIEGGGLSFVMPEEPAGGMVDVPASTE